MLKKFYRYSFKSALPQKSISLSLFTLRYQQNTVFHPQIAVVVSKKIDTKATVRNSIKRAVIKQIESILEGKLPSYDIVFYTKRAIATSSPEEIKNQITTAFTQANIL